jgi:hypothetical protein
MQPLQVWLPLLGGSIKRPKVGRDAARAFKEWRDELVVWTMPKLQRPRRWRSDGVGHLAVPAEEFERIDIVHVTEDGRIYAPTIKGRTPGTVDGLLYEWLNLYKNGGLSLVPAADSITVKAPRLDGPNEVSWTERTISIGPGTYLPISSVNRRRRTVSMVWPPEGAPAPISPESESAVRFPSKKVSSDAPTVVTAQGDRAPQLFLRWPGRLQPLMPPLSGVDDIQAQIDMEMLARRSRPELAEILKAATSSAHPYLFDGHSIVEHSWFRPTLEHKGIKHVLFKAEDRGLGVSGRSLDENALNEALKEEASQKWLAQPVPIRRVWGGVGLFWALLLERLQAQRAFGVCRQCGRIISGKETKRFCSESDDAECFRSRRAIDQRRSRNRRTNA